MCIVAIYEKHEWQNGVVFHEDVALNAVRQSDFGSKFDKVDRAGRPETDYGSH